MHYKTNNDMKEQIFGIICVLILGLLVGGSGCYYDNEEFLYPTNASCDTTNIKYSTLVLPMLQNNCLGCHSQASASGNVILEGYNNVKTYATNGKLYGVIAQTQGFSPMPKNGSKLKDCDISNLKRWVDAGALNN